MEDLIEKLNTIKVNAMMGNSGEVINDLNNLIHQLEQIPQMEITPAQSDLLPEEMTKQLLITGENATVNIYISPRA